MNGLNLLSDIASGPRLEILQILETSELKTSQIAKKMNTSIQALTRHIEKLIESKLVEKTPDGTYKLTSIAKVVLSQIPFFEFLDNHKEYFTTHDFIGIPDHLMVRMGELVDCDLEENVMEGMQRARDFCENAKESLQGATFTVPLEFFDAMIPNLKQGVHIKNTFGKNTIVSKGFSKYPARNEYLTYTNSGQVIEKIVEHIPLVVAITENECQLIFANKDLGYPDGKSIFFSKDPKFKKWCQELVDYYWNLPEVKDFVLIEQ